MDVELSEERVLVIADRVSPEEAEAKAMGKRFEAFGAMARLTGFLNGKQTDAVDLVYREHRLQPFWRIAATGCCAYERTRRHQIALGPEVRTAHWEGRALDLAGGHVVVPLLETCREESSKEVLLDALTGAATPALAAYLEFKPVLTTSEELAARSNGVGGEVVVPPNVGASAAVRDLLAGMIGRFDADVVTEERVRVEAQELIYRPVHAFKFRKGEKEAVVEVDAATGAVRTGGVVFETLMGKVMDPAFLLDFGVEAVNMFVPGARLAQIVVSKGVAAHKVMKGR